MAVGVSGAVDLLALEERGHDDERRQRDGDAPARACDAADKAAHPAVAVEHGASIARFGTLMWAGAPVDRLDGTGPASAPSVGPAESGPRDRRLHELAQGEQTGSRHNHSAGSMLPG